MPVTREEALRRWPRIVAHLIAESLGYFCPSAAAGAVAAAANRQPFYCEWYGDTACRMGGDRSEAYLAVTLRAVRAAIAGRKHHTGYMADYAAARTIVEMELQKRGCCSTRLASWF